MRTWTIGILIGILALTLFFEPSYGWKLRQFLSPQAIPGASDNGQADGANLAAENDVLAARVAVLQKTVTQLPGQPANDIRAMVYSRYPLNFKNELLVNVGARDGVTTGTAAIFEGMLVGRVIRVFPSEALIQTVFDGGFEMPVRVGTAGYDGLFSGGSYPRVQSIAKSVSVQAGDVIYAAAPGIPYGLPIGTVSAGSVSADSLFNEATVAFPYDINDIQTLFIAQQPS